MSKRVAIYHTGISDLVGGGGAPRFFFFLFAKGFFFKENNIDLFFLTDDISYKDIVDRLDDPKKKKLISLKNYHNRFKIYLESIQMLFIQLIYRFDIIHFPQFYPEDQYHRIMMLNRLPGFIRPKIVIQIVQSFLGDAYLNTKSEYHEAFHRRYSPIFNNEKIDGIYSWYEEFLVKAKQGDFFKRSNPKMHAIKYYCTDSDKFVPAKHKEKLVVWAARLYEIKDPFLYVDALKLVKEKRPDLFGSYKWLICGNGKQQDEVGQKLKNYNLSEVDFNTNISDMADIFSRSLCFVSTQNIENFTSLSMHEAMAAGNAILAKNVGQTYSYVHDKKNGLLSSEFPNTQEFAQLMISFLELPFEKQLEMGKESRRLVEEFHNEKNFVDELCQYYNEL